MTNKEAIARIKDHIEIHRYHERNAVKIFEALDMAINTLEKTQWIPCSERLPEENGRYLTTNSSWGYFEVDWNVWIDGEWLYPNENPIAWMPLPEPYKDGTRSCSNCLHYVERDGAKGCEVWECEYEERNK